MALTHLGCATWIFPGEIGSFQWSILQQSRVATISTPPSPLPPYVEMLPRSPPEVSDIASYSWKNHFLCTPEQQFAFLKSKPTFSKPQWNIKDSSPAEWWSSLVNETPSRKFGIQHPLNTKKDEKSSKEPWIASEEVTKHHCTIVEDQNTNNESFLEC